MTVDFLSSPTHRPQLFPTVYDLIAFFIKQCDAAEKEGKVSITLFDCYIDTQTLHLKLIGLKNLLYKLGAPSVPQLRYLLVNLGEFGVLRFAENSAANSVPFDQVIQHTPLPNEFPPVQLLRELKQLFSEHKTIRSGQGWGYSERYNTLKFLYLMMEHLPHYLEEVYVYKTIPVTTSTKVSHQVVVPRVSSYLSDEDLISIV